MRLNKITSGLAAALVLLAAVAGVPALLVAIGAAPTSVPSLGQLRRALLDQDQNMAVVAAVLAAVVWFCWAAFTVSTLREIASAISTRGRSSARPVQKLEWVGRPAAQLVAAVVLVFVAAPGLISATAAPAGSPVVATAPGGATKSAVPPDSGRFSAVTPAATRPTAVTYAATAFTASSPATPVRQSGPGTVSGLPETTTPTYTVRRRDTLWSIAGAQLGDPRRWPELAHLNPGVVGASPDFLIHAGSTLALAPPVNVALAAGAQQMVTVTAGETLSGIAAGAGSPDWHTIWPANSGRSEPGGAALSDPNHIEPGWTVVVPAASAPGAPPAAGSPTAGLVPAPAAARTSTAQLPRALSPAGTGLQDLPDEHFSVTPLGGKSHIFEFQPTRHFAPQIVRPETQPPNTPNTHNTRNIHHTPQGAVSPIGVFGAGGALLAGGVLGALLVARRRQSRNRRPGRTIAATTPELVPFEAAVLAHGRPGLASAQFLDAALRSLSAATAADLDGRLPDVVAVRHGGGQLNLRLSAAHRGPAPAPWTVDESGLWWSIAAEQELPVTAANASSYLAPLPTLAAMGSDSDGYGWLLDCERAGAIALTGDPDRCLDLARFLAAELAVNTWSDHLSVTMVGFGQELVALNPARLRYSADLEAVAEALSRDGVDAVDACTSIGLDVRTGRMRDLCGDTFMPQVLLVAPDLCDGSTRLADLLEMAATHQGQAALAIILAGDCALSGRASWTMHLTEEGHLLGSELGLDLIANQLPSREAAGLSQMLAQAGAAADEPMPPAAGDQPWQGFCDAAGALLPEHTAPRCEQGDGPPATADEAATCLLPLPDRRYLDAGATTAADLATLAPRAPATLRPAVEEADPTLDQDVGAWLDPDTDLPRLRLLGPVLLRAHGTLEKNRVGFYTEVVAYLATRENGATCAQFETSLHLAPARARSDIRVARNWLGVNPRTGRKHLPDALKSSSGVARGIGVYELEDVLVDADLFRRLRVRGQARGTDGIGDLSMALSLVRGAPFDQLRATGYEWLTEGVRLDHHLVCGIVDVAHLVTTHALATGDLTAARAAAELAELAAPYEEIPKLDLVAVRAAEGHLEDADAYLREQVCNRSEDGGPPEDLSARTQEILRARQWLSRAG
jgi:nucleoid-associated protein YgaU